MLLDIVIIITLGVFFALGMAKGAVRQALGLGILIFSTIVAYIFYRFLGEMLGISPIMAWSLLWLSIMVTGRLMSIWLRKILVKRFFVESMDRLIGSILGFIKGAVFVIVLLFIIELAHGIVDVPTFKKHLDNSRIASMITMHNPIKEITVVKKMNSFYKIQNNPDAIRELAKQDDFKKLMNHPKVKAVADNKDLQRAIEDKDYMGILKNQEIIAFMKDKEVRTLLMNIDVEKAYKDSEMLKNSRGAIKK